MFSESCANQSYERFLQARCLTVYTLYLPQVNSRVRVPQALCILYLVTLPHFDRTRKIFIKW